MKLKVLIKILVNLLTISRIVFSFVLFNIVSELDSCFFLVIITAIFFTDFLDGFLARKFEVQSLFGSVMDTIADKILSIILILPLLVEQSFIWIVLIGELEIALLNIIGKIRRKYTYSSMMGKLKMWLLSITIILGYIYYFGYIDYYIVVLVSILTFGLQIFVILEYYRYLVKQISNKKLVLYPVKSLKDLFYVMFSTEYFLEYMSLKFVKTN